MNLNDDQKRELARVEDAGRILVEAKQRLCAATAYLKASVFVAEESHIPLTRIADAAGVNRSAVYRWLRQEA